MNNKKCYKYLFEHNREIYGIDRNTEETIKVRNDNINNASSFNLIYEEIDIKEYEELRKILLKNNSDFWRNIK